MAYEITAQEVLEEVYDAALMECHLAYIEEHHPECNATTLESHRHAFKVLAGVIDCCDKLEDFEKWLDGNHMVIESELEAMTEAIKICKNYSEKLKNEWF